MSTIATETPTLDCDAGGWIQTYSGAVFRPLDPNPEILTIEDVVVPLSRMCRYGGHCERFYSVAEHCVLMADYLWRAGFGAGSCLQALMHDASEAFIADIVRPVKGMLAGYKPAELRLMAALSPRFGFAWPMLPEVHHLDAAMIAVERANMKPRPDISDAIWGAREPAPDGIELRFWDRDVAAANFRSRFILRGGAL